MSAFTKKDIQDAIRGKRPEQIKMELALWTREAVMKYIEERHGNRLPVRCERKPEQ